MVHPGLDTMISLGGFHQAKSLCQAFHSSHFPYTIAMLGCVKF